MSKFLAADELMLLDNFQLKMQLMESRMELLREQDAQRGLRAQSLSEKITALRFEIETLKLPDKKLVEQMNAVAVNLKKIRDDNATFIATLKSKYDIAEEDDFGYDPDSGQIVTREEARLSVEEWDTEGAVQV